MTVRRWVTDFLWPPRSLLGGTGVQLPGRIDPAQFGAVSFITAPLCVRCGAPLGSAGEAGQTCGACLHDPPDYDAARAPLAYNNAARTLVLDLKRGGRRDDLPVFARWMAQAAGDLDLRHILNTPMPLHWTRLIERRFNQAAWLAEALARVLRQPLKRDLLIRRLRRRGQGGLSAAGRRRNVAGAYRLPPARARLVAGRTILLVDDVLTTGATANACARALRAGGAARIFVLTLARVPQSHDLVADLT